MPFPYPVRNQRPGIQTLSGGPSGGLTVPNQAAQYDATRFDSMVIDSSDNVVLLSDSSGRSGVPSGDSYLELDGTAGGYASSPSIIPTGGVTRYEAKATPVTGSPANDNVFGSVYTSTADQRAWMFFANASTTHLVFTFTTDGSSGTLVELQSGAAQASTAIAIAAILDWDNGTADFEETVDGITWTAVGTQQTFTAALVPDPTSTASLNLGSVNEGALLRYTGDMGYFKIVQDGTDLFDADFTTRGASNQTFAESSSNAALVTINGSARITHLDTDNCLVLPGVVDNYAATPDSAALDVTGDIDIFCKISYKTLENAVLVAKDTTGGNRSFNFNVTSAGNLKLFWTIDGTSGGGDILSTDTIATTNTTIWVRAVLDVDDGGVYKVYFYTSTDGITWTPLGSVVSGGSTTSIYVGVAVLGIGGRFIGDSQIFTGNIYRAVVKNGIDGTTVFDADFTGVAKLATSFTESSSNAATVTINSTAIALPARIHGARDLYMGTAGSQPKYLPWAGTDYIYSAGPEGVTLEADRTFAPNAGNWQAYNNGTMTQPGGAGTNLVYLAPNYNPAFGLRLNFAYLTIGVDYVITITLANLVSGTSCLVEGSATPLVNGLNSVEFTATSTLPKILLTGSTTGFEVVPEFSIKTAVNTTVVDVDQLYFDGTDDYMKSAAFSLSQPENVYFLGKQVTWGNIEDIYDGLTTARMQLRQATSSPRIGMYALGSVIENGGFLLQTTGVVTSIYNAAASEIRVNLTTGVIGNSGSSDALGFTLGAQGDVNRWANMTVTTILIYDTTAHDAPTQTTIISHLMRKGSVVVPSEYFRPGGLDQYLRPGGADQYIRP